MEKLLGQTIRPLSHPACAEPGKKGRPPVGRTGRASAGDPDGCAYGCLSGLRNWDPEDQGSETVDDPQEIGRVERGPANQSAVDIGIGEEFAGIRCLATAAIEDRDLAGHVVSEAGGNA